MPCELRQFTRKVLIVAGIALLTIALAMIARSATFVLLLVFSAVLIAIVLRGLGAWIALHSRLSPNAGTFVMTSLIVVTLAGMAVLYGSQAQLRVSELSGVVGQAAEDFEAWADASPEARIFRPLMPSRSTILQYLRSVVTSAFGTFFSALTTFVIVTLMGLYITADPGVYRQGLMKLVPASARQDAEGLLNRIAGMLRRWFLGQAITMVVIGALTTGGLWLLGFETALPLGIFAGLVNFIPNFGPVIAAAPALLIAFSESSITVMHTALLYFAIQSFEGYLITPLVQSQAVALPPALTITFQVLLGMVAGLPGVALAVPLTVVGYTVINTLYVEKALGDKPAKGLTDRVA